MTEAAVRPPEFYVGNTGHSVIRVNNWFDIDIWSQRHGEWRKTPTPEHIFSDLQSPSFHEITAEEAQLRINRWGGGPDDALLPASESPTT